uniref:acid phosphatase n=1 Tax=Timema genevievae TaxID=629358 RepID=A0A7R9PHY4_TIMGE|nr:unnamed protein product [Timema genevievae]
MTRGPRGKGYARRVEGWEKVDIMATSLTTNPRWGMGGGAGAVLVAALLLSTGLVRSLSVDTDDNLGTIIFSSVCGKYFTLSAVLVVALLLSTGLVRSLPVDTGDDLGRIIFFSVIFRHGDRTILGSYRNDPYNNQTKYWPRGYEQLTEIGEDQHFKQGSFFRKRYNHILPKIYNVNDLYVRSTNIDRALASAQAHLAGLYPPTEQNLAQPNIKFQVIPIHTTTTLNDKELYGLPLPKWTKPYYPQPLENLFLFERFITSSATKELQRLSAGPILKKIIANTQAKVKGTLSPDRKLYIYSAHDTNVVDLLQGLKVFNGFLVPYASAVLIELRIKADKYFITDFFGKPAKPIIPDNLTTEGTELFTSSFLQVSYKNSTELDPYLLQLPGCDALCPLDSFVELTKPIIPDDLTTECAEEVVAGHEYHFEIPASGIKKVIFIGGVPAFVRTKSGEQFLKNTLSTPVKDSNLGLPVIGSIVYCECSALVHSATELANALVVLSSTAEDGEIELANTPVVLSQTTEDGEIEVRISVGTLKSPVTMEHFTLSTVLVVALLLSTGPVRSLPVDTGDDLGTIIFSSSLVCIGPVRSLSVDTGDDLGTIIFSSVVSISHSQPCWWQLCCSVLDLSDLCQWILLFRHGDRAPTGAYPNDIYNEEAKYWPRGYGQLSEIGEEQHFKQGSFFRKRYNHILPETYNVNDTYVRSSNIDRTLASARAHLAGLYPPTEQNLAQPNINFQVIPIHTTDMANDKELYNLSIPEWTTSYYPQPLRNLFLLESFIAAAGTEELQRLSTGPLLKEIIANTQAKVNGTLSPDRGLYIYSAHDSNVVDLLQGLDVFNGILVPYASAVMIELRNKSDEYFITVSYKNSTETDPYLLQLPGCDALCPLDSFVELTKPIIPDDLTTECAEEVVAGQEYHFEIPAAAILPEWEHCFQQPTVKDGRFHRISFTTKNHK